MLDYAASFGTDWPAERIRERREQTFAALKKVDGLEKMDLFLPAGRFEGQDQLWAEVQTKIDAGKIRLLLVADHLSTTLVKIIEYLNGQLRDAEALGVEVCGTLRVGCWANHLPAGRGRGTTCTQR